MVLMLSLVVTDYGRREEHVSHLPRTDTWDARGRVEAQRAFQG